MEYGAKSTIVGISTENDDLSKSRETDAVPSPKYSIEDLLNAIRYGTRMRINHICENSPALIHQLGM